MLSFLGSMFKSKEEREKDYQNYFKKIFPYGEPQKQKIQEIINDLINKKYRNQLMMHYVLIKQEMIESENKDYDAIATKIEKKKFVKLTPELKSCIRILIDKDLAMDDSLEYPTAQELKSTATKKKW